VSDLRHLEAATAVQAGVGCQVSEIKGLKPLRF